VQERFLKLVLKTKSGIHSKGAVMKYSNLAECLEEFAATLTVIDQPEPEQGAPRIIIAVDRSEKPAPRRLSLTARRMLVRDQGLRPFRVL
jgi:hypothetical protein